MELQRSTISKEGSTEKLNNRHEFYRKNTNYALAQGIFLNYFEISYLSGLLFL